MKPPLYLQLYSLRRETKVDAEGTIRKKFAESIERNSVHGSDSLENAKTEIAFFFTPSEIV
jgi:nucleoside diphosphate kinase